MAEGLFQRGFQRAAFGDLAHADAGAFTARLDDQRQAKLRHACQQRRFFAAEVQLAIQRHVGATGKPIDCHTILVRHLSMVSAEAITPLPV